MEMNGHPACGGPAQNAARLHAAALRIGEVVLCPQGRASRPEASAPGHAVWRKGNARPRRCSSPPRSSGNRSGPPGSHLAAEMQSYPSDSPITVPGRPERNLRSTTRCAPGSPKHPSRPDLTDSRSPARRRSWHPSSRRRGTTPSRIHPGRNARRRLRAAAHGSRSSPQ